MTAMEQIEMAFHTVSMALRNGKFRKEELKFIIGFCEAVIRATQKILDRANTP